MAARSAMAAVMLYPRHRTVCTNSAAAAGAATTQGLQKMRFVMIV